jgi:hypothetical protein
MMTRALRFSGFSQAQGWGYVFACADVFEQFFEFRDCRFEFFGLGVGCFGQQLFQASGCRFEFLEIVGAEVFLRSAFVCADNFGDPFSDRARSVLIFFAAHGPGGYRLQQDKWKRAHPI